MDTNHESRHCTAIVLAAGSGSRMHSHVRKQFLELGGYPLVWYSLDCFEKCPMIDKVILVTGEDSISYCETQIVRKYGFTKVARVVAGGAERYDSVYAGLLSSGEPELVLVHDSARPFVTGEMVEAGLEAAAQTGAAVIGVPSKDTVKLADPEGFVLSTPSRNGVWIVQTPQCFSFPLLLAAHEKLRGTGMDQVTDDAMVVEKAFGTKVRMVTGSYRNIKITTAEDLIIANAFLKQGAGREA